MQRRKLIEEDGSRRCAVFSICTFDFSRDVLLLVIICLMISWPLGVRVLSIFSVVFQLCFYMRDRYVFRKACCPYCFLINICVDVVI